MARARTLVLNTKVNVTGADQLRGLGRTLQQTGGLLTAGLTLPILGIGASLISAAEDAAKAQAKLTNVFDSMGAAAFTSIEALNAHAAALQDATTFDDEAINEAQAVLLTFGNITGDAFTRATEAALDMTALFDGDLQSAIVQVGKALNDPIKGVTALTRVGVSFTQQQLEQIRVLQESGDILGAQTIILAELERQFGGTAEALAQTAGGQMTQAMNQLNDAAEEFGALIAPLMLDVANGIKQVVKFLRELNPETKETVIRFAAVAAVLGPVLVVFGTLLRVLSPFAKLIKPLAGHLTSFSKALGISRLALLGWIGAIGAAGIAVGQGYSDVLDGLSGQILRDFAAQHGIAADQVTADVARISEALGVDIPEAQRRLLAGMDGNAESYERVVRGMVDSTNAATGEISEALLGAGAAWEDYQNQISGGDLHDAAATMANGIPEAMEEALEAGEEIARRTPGALANELRAGIEDYDEALAELTEVAVNSVSDLSERQKIEGILASQELTDALNSDSTRTRLLAADLVADLVSDYELLAPGALAAGELVNPNLAAGLRSNLGLTTTAAQSVRDAAGNPLVDLGPQAFGWGQSLSANFHAGMSSYIRPIREASIRLGDAAASGLRLRSPAEEGPLSEPADVWGKMLGLNFAKGLRDSIGAVKGASLAVAGAAVLSGSISDGLGVLPSLSPAVGGAGVVNNFYLRWDGEPPKGRNEEEIIGNLQRLSPLVGNALVGGS